MTTVRELLADAMIELGIIMPLEAMTADQAVHGLRVLNRMIQQWDAEELMIYTLDRDIFSFVAGQQSYTLGTSANFNLARPVSIHMASVYDSALALPVEIPISILTDEEWRNVSVKLTPSTFPTCMWVSGSLPANTLWFWPVPSVATWRLVLYSWGNTADFTSINDAVVFPKGYEEAIVTNLAVRMASSYGVPPDGGLIQRANQAKDIIASLNMDPLYASIDSSLLSSKGGSLANRSFGLIVDR